MYIDAQTHIHQIVCVTIVCTDVTDAKSAPVTVAATMARTTTPPTTRSSAGVTCVECSDASSEAECNTRGKTVFCAGSDAVCETRLSLRTDGSYRVSKSCDVSASSCAARRDATYNQCSRYRGRVS